MLLDSYCYKRVSFVPIKTVASLEYAKYSHCPHQRFILFIIFPVAEKYYLSIHSPLFIYGKKSKCCMVVEMYFECA